MTRFRLLGTAVLTAALTLGASSATPPQIGQTAPGFTLIDQNGKRVTLSSAHGAKAVLVFYRGYW